MGNIIEYIECEGCGGIVVSDYNDKTTEEHQNCKSCGTGFSYAIKRDEKSNAIKDEEGSIIIEFIEKPGFGVAYFGFKDGTNQLSSLNKELTPEITKDFLDELENNPNIVKEKCYLTKWDDENQELVSVYGNLPEKYEDTYYGCEEEE